jgi:LmbE family N-acetylglucosaminyl deacetylase
VSFLRIKNQRIIIVVAHPDDEVLWFFAGIEALKKNNYLEIFCLTYTSNSLRGMELISFGNLHQISITFADINDTGINCLLSEVSSNISNILNKNKYDLAITHPPHGGEKPHPHHIQAHFALKNECRRQNVKFAFFSEYNLQCQFIIANTCQLTRKNKNYIYKRLMRSYLLLNKEKILKKIFFFVKAVINLFFDYSTYELNEFTANIEEKKEALSIYKSQADVLTSYNSYYRTREYLFIRSSNYITSSEFNNI